jgi:hypothetical protein
MIEEHQQEKEKLYKYIESLIDNQDTSYKEPGHINNYGHEDLSHITDSFKVELLKGPYVMIQKLIEAIHFNKDKPENNNIIMPNKNENVLKIFLNNIWVYKDKYDTITDLIDCKNFILDNHFKYICNSNKINQLLNPRHITSYNRFQCLYDTKDDELHSQLHKECKLLLLNTR